MVYNCKWYHIKKRSLDCGLTVAKKSFPSSPPTPSSIFSNPDNVIRELDDAGGPVPNIGVIGKNEPVVTVFAVSLGRKVQSMSSIRTMLHFGMAVMARCKDKSSMLKKVCKTTVI